ncbi:nucleoside hydrolase-like domain-containing protein [Flexithrix dorotheae]|uniref:nucleoside hydrolase-like domain-containing protein n=1 Tax=Flexithrix dorotheae TaxID=70993 RepID=UPI00036BB497|nr:nucleoside hydrolase-like domain-containing protein [Flexithrix dorotheae]
MKMRLVLLFSFILSFQLTYGQTEKHRLIILADMGNEPDEVQQMVHMIMYSNEFDLEGLIAVTGKYLNPQEKRPYRRVLHPELFLEIIDGYELVRPNLLKHAEGWPQADYLRSIVVNGQTEYGIDGVGEGENSEGSDLIAKSLTKNDSRLVYIVVNAGSNTLAQALIDLKAKLSDAAFKAMIKKIRVFENGAQDNAGAWICAKFPEIHWIRSNFQTYCYGGPSWDSNEGKEGSTTQLGPYTWEPYEYSSMGQHHWTLTHIIGNHGYLGKVYPLRQMHKGNIVFLEGGGTIPWMGLIHRGLTDISQPHWGGWSGRYSRDKKKNAWSKHENVKVDEENYEDFEVFIDVADKWTDPSNNKLYENTYTPVWRWRRAYFDDFKCRMDWCVAEYEEANHNPIAAINGDETEKIHHIKTKQGEIINFDASASKDPDGDPINFIWWIYEEAGTYENPITLENPNQSQFSLEIPKDAKGKEIHLILEVTDENDIANLTDYRRIVINVD